MSRSQKKYYSSSSAAYSICNTQQPWTWLQSEGGNNFLVKKREIGGKGLQQGQSILSEIAFSLAVSSGQNPNEPLLVHSCSLRGKRPTHHPSAGGQNTKQGQQRTRRGQRLSVNPSGSLCHLSAERTIVQEHHLGKKENSTDPTVRRSEGISFAEADGALRSFLATCFPSSEKNQ